MFDLKRGLASLAIAGTLLGTTALGAAAAPPTQVSQNGAAGVVAATVAALNNVNVTDNTVDVTIVQLNNSLNNLRALNNVLNNSPILNNNQILQGITIQDINVAIANGSLNNNNLPILQNALQEANIQIGQVVGVGVLSGGDLIVFTR
jgi:hypothetical protein